MEPTKDVPTDPNRNLSFDQLQLALASHLVAYMDVVGFLLLCRMQDDPHDVFALLKRVDAWDASRSGEFEYTTRLGLDLNDPIRMGHVLVMIMLLLGQPAPVIRSFSDRFLRAGSADRGHEVIENEIIPFLQTAIASFPRGMTFQQSAGRFEQQLSAMTIRLRHLGVRERQPCMAEIAHAQLIEFGPPLHRCLVHPAFQELPQVHSATKRIRGEAFVMHDASVLVVDRKRRTFTVYFHMQEWFERVLR
ncbi:MAG TPA: hypothetical protein VN193_15330 [Candidatus Angelobacter sp.]|nr:hypothetical protein [Candidatus Angelobacter sp.]